MLESDTETLAINTTDIFVDRRQPNNQNQQNIMPCRRQNNFNKIETSSWWLKVNYVKQHLSAVGNQFK